MNRYSWAQKVDKDNLEKERVFGRNDVGALVLPCRLCLATDEPTGVLASLAGSWAADDPP